MVKDIALKFANIIKMIIKKLKMVKDQNLVLIVNYLLVKKIIKMLNHQWG